MKQSDGMGEAANMVRKRIESMRDRPVAFKRLAIGLAALGFLIIMFVDQQPGVCNQSLPPVCSSSSPPNPGMIGMTLGMLFFGFAGFAAFHAYELRKKEEKYASEANYFKQD